MLTLWILSSGSPRLDLQRCRILKELQFPALPHTLKSAFFFQNSASPQLFPQRERGEKKTIIEEETTWGWEKKYMYTHSEASVWCNG